MLYARVTLALLYTQGQAGGHWRARDGRTFEHT